MATRAVSADFVSSPGSTSSDKENMAESNGTSMYELDVRQQPRQARMAGAGAKADRRPLDPPPIIRLRIRKSAQPKNDSTSSSRASISGTGSPTSSSTLTTTNRPAATAGPSSPGSASQACRLASSESQRTRRASTSTATKHRSLSSTTATTTPSGPTANVEEDDDPDVSYTAPTLTHTLFCFASLVGADHDKELYQLSGSRSMHVTGSVVSSLFHLKDQSCFVFPDLSVRTEGRFRFKMSLFEILEDGVRFCTSVFTDPFQVYSSKRFPGMGQSTELSKAFAQQGLRLRIRRPGPIRDEGDEDEDDDDLVDDDDFLSSSSPKRKSQQSLQQPPRQAQHHPQHYQHDPVDARKRPATSHDVSERPGSAHSEGRRVHTSHGVWTPHGALSSHPYGATVALTPRTGKTTGPPIFSRELYKNSPGEPAPPVERPPRDPRLYQSHRHSYAPLKDAAFGVSRPAPASAFYSAAEIAAAGDPSPLRPPPPPRTAYAGEGFAPPRPPTGGSSYLPRPHDPYGARGPLSDARDRRLASPPLPPVRLPPLRGHPPLHGREPSSSSSSRPTTADSSTWAPREETWDRDRRESSTSQGSSSARYLDGESVRLPKLRKIANEEVADRSDRIDVDNARRESIESQQVASGEGGGSFRSSNKLSMLLGEGTKDAKSAVSDGPLFF